MKANKKACVVVAEQICNDLIKSERLGDAFKGMDEAQHQHLFDVVHIALTNYSYALCYKPAPDGDALCGT